MVIRSDPVAFAQSYFDSLCQVLRSLPLSDLARALEILERAHAEGRQVFLAGNGGSAATASHMASDLMRGAAQSGRRGFRAVALSDNVPLITAIANDEGYQETFAGQLSTLAQPGDLLLIISGSGNSSNVVRAAQVARQMGLGTIAFLGKGGGRLASMVDVAVIVPSDDYGLIEDIHMAFDHMVTAYFRESLHE